MQIGNGHVVAVEYTLRDDDGDVIDSSEGDEPLVYLHGVGQIVPGLEKALEGHAVGDTVKVSIPPEDGYGTWDPEQVVRVPRDRLPADAEPEEGMELTGTGPHGEEILLRVVEVEGDVVTLDANHPLAGRTLNFDVTVKSVRAATQEELSHGHAHGDDGHHHH